jgi:hypothetical protein
MHLIIIIIQFTPLFLGLPKNRQTQTLYQAPQTVKIKQNPLKKTSTLKPVTTNLEILKFKGKNAKTTAAEPVKYQNTDQKDTPKVK